MRHGSLFSGIGGFDLAAEWMGWENVFHCEWNEFGQRVLKHYWPNAESFDDITKTDFTKYANKIDILSGGFPCQPFSMAGKRKGTNDERYLWHEMLRAIQEIKPKFVIAENVFGITNIDGGLVFEQVCLDLEAEGYEVQPFVIPAAAKNAPHRRDRCWFIAQNTQCNGRIQRESKQERTVVWKQRNTCSGSGNGIYLSEGIVTNANGTEQRNNNRTNNRKTKEIRRNEKSDVLGELRSNGNASDTESQRSEWIEASQQRETGQQEQREFRGSNCQDAFADTECSRRRKILQNLQSKKPNGKITNANYEQINWTEFPTQSPICGGDDGIPTKLDGITFSKWRAESIKAYGNAIVPQVAYEIFKAIIKTAP